MTELYARACLYARDKHLEDKDVPAFIQCMSEKFAELIVRECMNVLDPGEHQLIARFRARQWLADHFGVE